MINRSIQTKIEKTVLMKKYVSIFTPFYISNADYLLFPII